MDINIRERDRENYVRKGRSRKEFVNNFVNIS